MSQSRVASFLRDAWGGLVGLEEAVHNLGGVDAEAAREALANLGHRLESSAAEWSFPRLTQLAGSLERLGLAFPPPDHPSFEDAVQLVGDTITVLPMVFDNIASEASEDIPQLAGLQWRFDTEVPAAEALAAERARAAAPGEVDLALLALRLEDPEALAFFGPEAGDHVEGIHRCLAALALDAADAEVVKEMFRRVHTIKGAAYTVDCGPIGDLAHGIESLFAAVHQGTSRLTRDDLELCTSAIELMAEMLDRLGGGEGLSLQATFDSISAALAARCQSGETPSPAATRPGPEAPATRQSADAAALSPSSAAAGKTSDQPAAAQQAAAQQAVAQPPAFQASLRVGVRRIDRLIDEAGEVIVSRRRLHPYIGELTAAAEHLASIQGRLDDVLATPADSPAQDPSGDTATSTRHRLVEVKADVAALGADLATMSQGLSSHLDELRTRTRRLRSDVARMRRSPIGQLFERFDRLVAESAAMLGKKVKVVSSGAEVELDHEVMERLAEPLTHLVQNAVHHGLETSEQRLAEDKSRAGTLSLTARRWGRRVRIDVADDGRGIDLEALRRVAAGRGFIDPRQPLDDQETLELLFLPGLSTSRQVSTGAGRGVGMDAVRHAVARLGGQIFVDTEAGTGTCFTLETPATLLVSEALEVTAGGQVFAVPISAVRHLVHVFEDQVIEDGGKRLLETGGERLELISVSNRLGLPEGRPSDVPGVAGIAVAVAGTTRPVALVVEEVSAAREVVIKSLGDFLSGSTLFTGASVNREGQVILLLDTLALIDEPARVTRPLAGRSTDSPRPAILVVDDSLTVRRWFSRRLMAAGFEVRTARDGVEALDELLDGSIFALITDLEMPEMSGAELIQRVRRHRAWRHLPIAVVTGRPRGEELAPGADLYLSKPVDFELLRGLLEPLLDRARADNA